MRLQRQARQMGLVAKSILDAGRTQIAAGSRTGGLCSSSLLKKYWPLDRHQWIWWTRSLVISNYTKITSECTTIIIQRGIEIVFK